MEGPSSKFPAGVDDDSNKNSSINSSVNVYDSNNFLKLFVIIVYTALS